jgi:hypothetical protein
LFQEAEAPVKETPLAQSETQVYNAYMTEEVKRCRTQVTTVKLEVTQLEFDEVFQVRKIDQLHVDNIKILLAKNPDTF